MCIAILKTKKGKIEDTQLEACFENNPDGAGIAYTKDNELFVEKGFFDKKEFIKAVREIEQICDNNMLIHCRIGTSGKVDKYNTHPFFVNKDVCMIHNGILDIPVPKKSQKNDTQIFIETYLSELDKELIMHNKDFAKILKRAIGSNNKFVFLDNKGYYKIINEEAGHWLNDVWYSNYSYIKRTYKDYNFMGYTDLYDDYDEYDSPYYKQTKLKIKTEYLSSEEIELVSEQIASFTLADFVAHGDNPIYSFNRKRLITYEELEPNEDAYLLEELCPFLLQAYLEYWDTEEEMLEEADENRSKQA